MEIQSEICQYATNDNRVFTRNFQEILLGESVFRKIRDCPQDLTDWISGKIDANPGNGLNFEDIQENREYGRLKNIICVPHIRRRKPGSLEAVEFLGGIEIQ
jgi:hypothetical protein